MHDHGPPNVFLVGLMGVGKTTVGRYLADALGLPFYDSDQVIEDRAGAHIPWIFDIEGESGFRDRETAVVEELTALHGIVLATGGGAVLRPENRRVLHERGTCIYLHGSVDQLTARTARDRRRPLLRNGNPREILARLLREREALYREVAHHVFVTDRRPARLLAAEIRQRVWADEMSR